MAESAKTFVITGAASGMGKVLARRVCAQGNVAVMCDIDAMRLKESADEINIGVDCRAYACVVDVRRYADAEKAAALALDRTGRIDVLVNFAGGWEPRMLDSMKPFHEQPVETLDWGIDVNLRGAVYFARACMPAMIVARTGVVCNVGSVNGFFGDGMGPMYGAAKAGLFNFAKSLALDGAKYGIRAFCVAPGPVLTRSGMAAMETPLGRAASPDEVVDFILHLCSEKCSFVTGSTHVIDGGFLAMRPKA